VIDGAQHALGEAGLLQRTERVNDFVAPGVMDLLCRAAIDLGGSAVITTNSTAMPPIARVNSLRKVDQP
jgi:hypothetical protein